MTTGASEPLDPIAVEQALLEELQQVTDAHTRALVAAWALAWSEISAELLDTLGEAMAAGARVTAATIVRTIRLQQVLAQVADALEDLVELAGITVTGDLRRVVDMAVNGTTQLMAAQVPQPERRERLDLERRPRSRALDAIVDRFTEQVTSTTLPLADETYEVIQREVTRGVAVGDNPRETAARIVDRSEDHWNLSLTRALTIARTEVGDAYREGARAQQDEHADVLAGWVWLAHLSPRTCRSCMSMHGQVFDLSVAGPHDHQQGRCSRTPVVAEDDGTFDTSWVPDAEEFFAGLDQADQEHLLGRRGYTAWVAGDFPREEWTRTRSVDGWRDSQVPASPGQTGGGSGRGSTTGAPGGSDDETHRDRALRLHGPAPAGEWSDENVRAYWLRRQGTLPVDFGGDSLHPHEVEFVEQFLDAGETLRWLPRQPGTPTYDFEWTSNDGQPFELKSTRARAATIHGRLVDAMSRAARNHGITKENFIVDLGDQPMPDDLLEQLGRFNVGRRNYLLSQLWVMAGGQLQRIPLEPVGPLPVNESGAPTPVVRKRAPLVPA